MVVTYQLVLSGTAKRLSDVYGGAASVPDETKNIPYRQLLLTTTGSVSAIGGSNAVTPSTGLGLVLATAPLSLGPFETGPVKLSDLYAVGTGATITILGVPF